MDNILADRFKQTTIKIIRVSQCSNCPNNISYLSCTEFSVKPVEYADNLVTCPKLKGGV